MSSRTLRRPAPQQLWPRRLAPVLLDNISVPATNAYSCCRKLRASYTGPALRVRRSSDNVEQDIGFSGAALDQAALVAFVGAGSGYVSVLYDQSGNGRDLAQATAAAQPRIVNAGVIETYPSGAIVMSFDGVDDRLTRNIDGNTTGMSGNPLITMGAAFQITNTTVSCVPCGFGNITAATGTTCVFHRSTAASTSMKKQHGNTDRNFTLISQVNTAGHAYVMQHPGGNVHSGSMRQNGAPLAAGSTTGTAVALNLADNVINLGTNVSGGSIMTGKLNALILFNAVLAGADLAALEAELALHVTPLQLALDKISVQPLIAVSAARKLRAAYAGPCMRVRRSSDDAEQDIGFAANVLDTAALLAFVGAGSGYVVTAYDQGPAARHLSQSDPTRQPIIVNAGALVVTMGTGSLGVPTMDLGIGRTLARADACGMTGAPALTMGTRIRVRDTVGYPFMCTIGVNDFTTSSGGFLMSVDGVAAGNDKMYVGINIGPSFTVTTWGDLASSYYVARAAAGQRCDQHRMRQNGIDSPLYYAGVDPAQPLGLLNGKTALGGGDGASASVFRYLNGDGNVLMIFNADLAGADLNALETELAAHR